ncbi:MAG: hypothetical protein H6597_06270 [Flavobacteriales bacterium]|nr:hypothetical protein [Flavobacteriales bacterium]MCB9194120.1 hypothetical protein [Flavobacteriales bacterium]
MALDTHRFWRSLIPCTFPIVLAWSWVSWQGYQGLNGQDAHDYHLIAQGYATWMHGGGARPAMVEHPHGYPIAGVLLGGLLGSTLIGLRAISACSLLLLAGLMIHLVRRARWDRGASIALVLTMTASAPFLLRYALTVMSDLPGIALVFGAYVCCLHWIAGGADRWLVLSLLVAALALTVRLATAPMLCALVAGVLILRIQDPGKRRLVLTLVMAVSALFAAAWSFWPRMHIAPLRPLLGDWSLLALFERVHRSDDGLLRYALPNVLYLLKVAVHPGFIPLGIVLLPFARRKDLNTPEARLALWPMLGYLLFIGGMPYQNDRVLLMAQPFVAVLFFPAFGRAWARLVGARVRWAITLIVVMGQLALSMRAVRPFVRQAQLERELAGRIQMRHPQLVYTHGMGAAFRDLCPDVPVRELWYGVVEDFQSGGLVVVQPLSLEQQWQGEMPWINYRHALGQGLTYAALDPEGWVVQGVK